MISMQPLNLPSRLLTPSLIALSLALKLDAKQKGGWGRLNVRSAKCPSAKCPFGQMSYGQMSVGQMSFSQMTRSPLKTAGRPPMKEVRAGTDQSLGWTETTHTHHTGTMRSQLLDLHLIPTHC